MSARAAARLDDVERESERPTNYVESLYDPAGLLDELYADDGGPNGAACLTVAEVATILKQFIPLEDAHATKAAILKTLSFLDLWKYQHDRYARVMAGEAHVY